MFYDSTDILDAAFEADWERFINGGFLNGVGIKGMPLGDIFKEHSMLSEVRSAFRAGFPLLLKVFKYYSSREEPHQIQSTEIVAVNLDNFTQFCEDTKITDEKFPNDFVRKAWQGAMLDPDAQHLDAAPGLETAQCFRQVAIPTRQRPLPLPSNRHSSCGICTRA